MTPPEFRWPDGKRAALSISFDDARPSQVDVGLPILDAHSAKGTFYVSLGAVKTRLVGWEQAVANGHEIGNHSLRHACSANFPFGRGNALEGYTIDRMERELLQASDEIEALLGVRPRTFAYPCGQTFVGRGVDLKSYVPVVARHFLVGRRAFDESHTHPVHGDLARAASLDADGAPFERIKGWLDAAAADTAWVILMAHNVGDGGRQTMLADVLDEVCRHATDPANGIWLDTVAAVGEYIATQQSAAG